MDNKISAKKQFYTAQEIADMFGVNIMTVYRYIKAKKLNAYKIGKEFRVEHNEFESFLNKARTS